MTTFDEYAKEAMGQLIALRIDSLEYTISDLANDACRYAQAMMEARAKYDVQREQPLTKD